MEYKGLILNKFQSAFRKQRSCEDHIIRLADNINKNINNRGYTLAVFIDLGKAFDRMWKDGLLCKIQKLGIGGRIYEWIRDF